MNNNLKKEQPNDLHTRFQSTRKWRTRLRIAAPLVFLGSIGLTYLFKNLQGFEMALVATIPAGLVVTFILMYLINAIFKCPACKKNMGSRGGVAICPSCGHSLYNDKERQPLADRIRDYQVRAERPLDKPQLVSLLENTIILKKLTRLGFYVICGLMLVAAVVMWDINWARRLILGSWVVTLAGFLLFNFFRCRCPLCNTLLEPEDRFCTNCGLGNK